MKIELKRLSDIPKEEMIALFNHPLVRRHMPLTKSVFDDDAYQAFLADKEYLWNTYGYGPWAFVSENKFLGWGGLQYEEGDADLALVLHPDFWGLGKVIYEKIIQKAFEELRLESITILLPPSRNHLKGIFKLGFKPDGERMIKGERFLRYRLKISDYMRNKDSHLHEKVKKRDFL